MMDIRDIQNNSSRAEFLIYLDYIRSNLEDFGVEIEKIPDFSKLEDCGECGKCEDCYKFISYIWVTWKRR